MKKPGITLDPARGARTSACRVETHLDACCLPQHSLASERRQEWRRGTQKCVRHVPDLKVCDAPNSEVITEPRASASGRVGYGKLLLAGLAMAALVFAQAPAPAKPTPVPSYKDLKYPPLPQIKVPVPTQFTLSNGIRVYLLEDHELPLISGTALVRTGNLFDPADKRGLSQVMAEVQRSGGTKAKTGDQIDEELENMAASVESGMDETNASVGFSGLKESTDAVLAVFKDVLVNPEFRQDKIDLTLAQLRSVIARRNDDADGIPGRELAGILYGRDNSYGWTIEYEHIARIKRDDLIAFYRRYYFPKNIMLSVYGDFQTAEMKDKLERLFADWKVEQPAVPAFPPVTAKPAPGVYLGEKPEVTQTFFSMGHLGGTFLDKDYAALQVAANILGQGFSSRLVTQIRTKLGYAYNIGAYWSASYNHPGTFTIAGSTKSSSTVATLQAVDAEVNKIRTQEVSERELDEAKQAALNSFVFRFDSPAKTLNRVVLYDYFGYPNDFLFQYQKAIAAVTRADVLRAARDRFRPQDFAIVAVGNPKDFDKPLSTLGKVNVLDLSIPEPKPELAASDSTSVARGGQLIDRAQQAMGGFTKLAGIKDITQTVEMTVTAAPGGLKMKQVNRTLGRQMLRQEQELPFGKVIAFTDGNTGWLSTPQGVMNMPAEVLRQAQGELFRQIPSLMTSNRDASRSVNAVGENTVEISGNGLKVRVEFDPSTGLPSKLRYSESGGPEIVEILSDWRDTPAGKLPFKLVLEQNGNKAAEGTVTEYRVDTGLTAEELSKKP